MARKKKAAPGPTGEIEEAQREFSFLKAAREFVRRAPSRDMDEGESQRQVYMELSQRLEIQQARIRALQSPRKKEDEGAGNKGSARAKVARKKATKKKARKTA
jgi:hypothetical protein